MTSPQTISVEDALAHAMQSHEAGNLAGAEALYRQILAVQPDCGSALHQLGVIAAQVNRNEDAVALIRHALQFGQARLWHYNLGCVLQALGRMEEAINAFGSALALSPDYLDAISGLGIVLQKAGRLSDAVAHLSHAAELKPDGAAEAWNLAYALYLTGDYSTAAAQFLRAAALNPGDARIQIHLGHIRLRQGQLDEAWTRYEQALALQPGSPSALNGCGLVRLERGDLDGAELLLARATEAAADYAEAWHNLGMVRIKRGAPSEALEACRNALQLQPDSPDIHNNMGAALHELGRENEAIAYFRQALQLRPDYPEVLTNLSSALKAKGHVEDAMDCCQRALAISPDYAEAYIQLGTLLQLAGDMVAAFACFERALELEPDDALRLKVALTLPVIYPSREDIVQSRQKLVEQLADLGRTHLTLGAPWRDVGTTSFYLAYQGVNNRDVQATLARLYLQALPRLAYVAPHCVSPLPVKPGEKIRVGFVSRYLYRHSVGMSAGKLIIALAQTGYFDIFLLRTSDIRDELTDEIATVCAGDHLLSRDLWRAQKDVAALRLDALIFTDIGMEAFGYFLAFSRLAPVQCVKGGHPDTSGIPTMDYYLSHRHWDTEHAQAHYTEKLVRFHEMPTIFAKPMVPVRRFDREELGLSQNRLIIICPVKLQKIHPDFDDAIGAILHRLPNAEVVLFQDHAYPSWHRLLQERFNRTFPEVADRVSFLPWASGAELFYNYLLVADIILDPFHFGLGTTAYMAFALGTPVVTLPSGFMGGRGAYACYREMQVTDAIAETPEHYVELVCRFAQDDAAREALRSLILERNAALFDNAGCVPELARFLIDAVERARSAPGRDCLA